MDFTWDPRKAAQNAAKHGVALADAALIFDGFVTTVEDTREDYGEQRFVSLGLFGAQVFVVVHVIEEDNIHLISARKAEKYEARFYWQEYAKYEG